MSETAVRLDQLMPVILEQLARGGSVRFTPRGTSMRPMLEGGRDQVILSPLPQRLKKYDLPLYQRENGQYVLHRVIKAGETYTCIGDNQFDREPDLRQDQMLALVTAFVRRGRTWQVSSPAYRLYCRLWCASRPVRRWLLLLRRAPAAIKRRLMP